MRKRYSSAFKAKAVIELLKEEKTLAQLAADLEVSTKQLNRWKSHALSELPRLFEGARDRSQEKYEATLNQLYAEIGRLTTQLSWLKKNLASTMSRAIGPGRAACQRAEPDGAGRAAELEPEQPVLPTSTAQPRGGPAQASHR